MVPKKTLLGAITTRQLLSQVAVMFPSAAFLQPIFC